MITFDKDDNYNMMNENMDEVHFKNELDKMHELMISGDLECISLEEFVKKRERM